MPTSSLNTSPTSFDSIRHSILDRIKKHFGQNADLETTGEFLKKIDHFLQRLAENREGQFIKDEISLKASRQLLCCIGIDICSDTVPIEHYINIFKSFDLEDKSTEARHLFSSHINAKKLLFKESEKKETEAYNVMIFPICDWTYYIDGNDVGLTGDREASSVYSTLIDLEKKGLLKFCAKDFNKNSYFGHFWLTTEEEINAIRKVNNTAKDIVDKLGLSHLEFTNWDFKYFLMIKIGKKSFETFKPNATMVDWSNPKTGFLSHSAKDSGRTFSITGYSNYQQGIKERVFSVLSLEADEINASIVSTLRPEITVPILIKMDEIIEEGISRFKSIKNS
jgi:hypothetical protein